MADRFTRGDDCPSPTTVVNDGAVSLHIDREVFSVDAVLRSAYKLSDRCHVFVQTHDTEGRSWLVTIRAKTGDQSADALAGDFSNELVDQQLRLRLESQFGDIRTLIVAQAFSEGNLLRQEDEDEYVRDPQGIGRLRP